MKNIIFRAALIFTASLCLYGALGLVEFPLFAETKAICIGVSQYAEAEDVPGARNDPFFMRDAMVKHGLVEKSNILVVNNLVACLKNNIIRSIKKQGKDLGTNDTLIVYYSGHGTVTKYNLDGEVLESAVCARDGYISSEELGKAIATSGCGKVIFINQSCHSDGLELKIPGKFVCQLNAASADQVSWNSFVEEKGMWYPTSAFTKAFIEGLEKAPDINDDGEIDTRELLVHIKKTYPQKEPVKYGFSVPRIRGDIFSLVNAKTRRAVKYTEPSAPPLTLPDDVEQPKVLEVESVNDDIKYYTERQAEASRLLTQDKADLKRWQDRYSRYLKRENPDPETLEECAAWITSHEQTIASLNHDLARYKKRLDELNELRIWRLKQAQEARREEESEVPPPDITVTGDYSARLQQKQKQEDITAREDIEGVRKEREVEIELAIKRIEAWAEVEKQNAKWQEKQNEIAMKMAKAAREGKDRAFLRSHLTDQLRMAGPAFFGKLGYESADQAGEFFFPSDSAEEVISAPATPTPTATSGLSDITVNTTKKKDETTKAPLKWCVFGIEYRGKEGWCECHQRRYRESDVTGVGGFYQDQTVEERIRRYNTWQEGQGSLTYMTGPYACFDTSGEASDFVKRDYKTGPHGGEGIFHNKRWAHFYGPCK